MSKALLSESLVKYETPILVSSSYQSVNTGSGPKPANLQPPTDKNPQARTEDYLNKILPPQETIENNQLWVRYVSGTPATAVDVENLTVNLDKRLQQKAARDSGICTVREELFSQCFDELIRQITINCAERGYLLVRVRDEMRMYKQTLQNLYESSIAYGMKKALVAQQSKHQMQKQISDLEKECKMLDAAIVQLEEDEKNIFEGDQLMKRNDNLAHKENV